MAGRVSGGLDSFFEVRDMVAGSQVIGIDMGAGRTDIFILKCGKYTCDGAYIGTYLCNLTFRFLSCHISKFPHV